MYHFISNLTKLTDNVFRPIVTIFYNLKLKPNHLSMISFLLGVSSALYFYFGILNIGFIFLAFCILFDMFDGALARNFNFVSKQGEYMDLYSDRLSELIIFVSLYLSGFVNFKLLLLAYYAIILSSSLRKKAKFDLGFKRITLFLYFIFNFEVVFQIIFVGNLISFVMQLLILDYELDRKQVEQKLKV
tara:strand:- start:7379 stop:7942 length:564 start_codon:yes stop_codon:yes gene_type:complete